MPDLSGIDQIVIIGLQRGAYVEDEFDLEGLDGGASLVDIINELSQRIENIEVGDGRTRYVQQVESQATDTITVTANGGELPPDDAYITLHGPTGPIFQGAGAGKYTINRAASPNQLILGTTPLSPINLYLEFWI